MIYQQFMFNFNNKIVIQETDYLPWIQQKDGSQQLKISEIAKRQGSATQCLLLLSEQQQPDKLLNNFSKHQDLEEFGVTPWTNTSFKAKTHAPGKSKTSILLPPCDRQFKQNKLRTENRDNENKENKHIRGTTESRGKIKVNKKNSDQLKNSYSAIARYNDCPSDILNFPTGQLSECKNEVQPIYLKTSSHTNQYNKVAMGTQNKSKLCSRIQKENEMLDIIACIVPKIQQNGHSMSVHKNMRTYMHCGTSMTGPILKQNTGIINDVGTKNSNFANLNHDYLKEKNINCVSQFNITPYDLQCGAYKSSKVQMHKKQPNQLNQGCQSEFQMLCEEQRKAGSEYQKIKRQIMENIQKQSIIRSSVPVQNKNSKKMLGRYFKQLQSKKSKCKIKSNTANLNRTESSQHCYETSNPLTKHLFEKYRLLISRGK